MIPPPLWNIPLTFLRQKKKKKNLFTDFGAFFYLFPASKTCTFYPLALFFTCIFFYNVTCSLPDFWAPQDQDWSFVFTGLCSAYRRRQWQPTTVLLPGKSHGRRSLVGCSPWGRKELDTTERLHFHFSLHALEKEMATHSSVLAWRIPGMGGSGGLQSMGSHRVGQDWSDLAAAAAAQHIVHTQWRFSLASWNNIFGSCKYTTLMAPKIAMPVWLACATLSIYFPEWN